LVVQGAARDAEPPGGQRPVLARRLQRGQDGTAARLPGCRGQVGDHSSGRERGAVGGNGRAREDRGGGNGRGRAGRDGVGGPRRGGCAGGRGTGDAGRARGCGGTDTRGRGG